MFGFSRRRMKLGRLKIQLADSTQGMRSPIRHPKRFSHSNGESVVSASNHSLEMRSDDLNCHSSLSGLDLNICTSGNSENWMPLSTIGDRPAPCFNHAATVIGSKMVVVGGESGNGLLDDVQVLNFNKLTWTVIRAAPKAYLSPTTLPPKIPPCKGHCLVSWGKQALLIGGKTEPVCDKVSVWAFDVDTECWSHLEARGDIPVPPQLNLRSLKQFLGFHSENLGLWSKVARSGHTVTRAGSVLILFGGEDAKGRKLNDLHMFDLKSLMWLPLHYTGTGPSPRSNHVATLYDDRVLFIFGGASKSRTLNDLYTLDFETMIWSRIKPRGLNPSPRAGCHGVLCGAKWYITGGGSRKKRHAETLMFDVLKVEWSVAVTSPPSSVTTNKGFSLVLVQHKEKVCLVAFGGNKKELSNQVEYLIVEQSVCQRSSPDKDSLLVDKRNTIDFTTQLNNCAPSYSVDAAARQNLASMQEFRCSNRKSLSESSCVDQSSVCGNVLLHKQFHQEEEYNSTLQVQKNLEDDKESDDCSILNSTSSQVMEQKSKSLDPGIQMDVAGSLANAEESPFIFGLENSRNFQKQVTRHPQPDNDDLLLPEIDGKSVSFTAPANIYQLYETKLAALLRKNGLLEGQLAAALASREALEKNLSAVLKSRHDMDKKLTDTVNEMELLKEKLAAAEIAQEEANSLSNIVHSDNVRLEHDVAFLKAVLDDTQKELHSTRGVLAGEKARTFQLQVEVFHLKQRLQSIEYRAPTPRKPFHV